MPKKEKKKIQEETLVRINKFIANSGLCSRRQADEYIKNGYITVNDKLVKEVGTKISLKDKIKYKGRLLKGEKNVYIIMNKPRNTVTTVSDPEGRRTIIDLLHNKVSERVYPVGRLDRNTTGVILLTNDGELTSKLTHPRNQIPKVYYVTIDKPLTKNDLITIGEGIELDDGFVQVDKINYCNLDNKTEIGVEIHSGKNRIIRRIFEKMGYEVIRLDRTYFASLTKKNLKRGYWRNLTDKEVGFLKMLKKIKK